MKVGWLVALLSVAVGALAQQQAGDAQAWTVRENIPKGRIEARTIESKIYGHARKVTIYTPAGYERSGHAPYGVLYFFDADDYLSDMSLPTVLDNLVASGKIPAVVAVLIDNTENRLGDLANREQFVRFMVEEVVPFVRASWNVTSDPQRTVVGGYSAGGLAAAYVAFKAPGVFGNVLSQSGAFWRGNEGASEPYEWLTGQFAASPQKPLRFYLEVGGEETRRALGSGPVFIEANRRMIDVLKSKGYAVSYTEVPGAQHEPKHWRTQLPEGLLYLTTDWERKAVAAK